MYMFSAVLFMIFIFHLSWSLYVMLRIVKLARDRQRSEASRRIAIKASLYISVVVVSQLPILLLVCFQSTISGIPTIHLNHIYNLTMPFIGLNNLAIRKTMRTPLGKAINRLFQRVVSPINWVKSTLGTKERTVEPSAMLQIRLRIPNSKKTTTCLRCETLMAS